MFLIDTMLFLLSMKNHNKHKLGKMRYKIRFNLFFFDLRWDSDTFLVDFIDLKAVCRNTHATKRKKSYHLRNEVLEKILG